MQNHTELATTQTSQWDNQELVETLKNTVCKGATDAQFRMFVEVCKSTGLNPFLKEIWYVPNVGVMAGRDGYLRVANEHPMFDGMETLVERDENNIPIKATCKVWRKDRSHPITCEAFFNEYRKQSQVWNTYKSAMISKVAEVLALKRSFAINGIITEEEIGQHGEDNRQSQQAYAEATIAINNQRRLEQGKAPIVEANPVRQAPVPPEASTSDYEKRHTALIMEAAEILDQPPAPMPDPPAPPKKKKQAAGSITYEAVQEIGALKKELRKLTGTDTKYYEILQANGVEHSNQLSITAARTVYKALAAARTDAVQKAELKQLVEQYWKALGDEKFLAILGANGCENIEQIFELNGTQLQGLLNDFKGAQS